MLIIDQNKGQYCITIGNVSNTMFDLPKKIRNSPVMYKKIFDITSKEKCTNSQFRVFYSLIFEKFSFCYYLPSSPTNLKKP